MAQDRTLNNILFVDPEVGEVLHKFSTTACLRSMQGYCKSSLTGPRVSILLPCCLSAIVQYSCPKLTPMWFSLMEPVAPCGNTGALFSRALVTSSNWWFQELLSCLYALLGCSLCLEPKAALVPRKQEHLPSVGREVWEDLIPFRQRKADRQILSCVPIPKRASTQATKLPSVCSGKLRVKRKEGTLSRGGPQLKLIWPLGRSLGLHMP